MLHVLLNFISMLCCLYFYSLLFISPRVYFSVVDCLWVLQKYLRLNFYIPSVDFSLSFSLSSFFPSLSPFLSWWQSHWHEINFSSWDGMTLACGACDIEANGYTVLYHCARVTIHCRLPIALSVGRVYELCEWGVFSHLISFFSGLSFLSRDSILMLLTLTNDIVCASVY